jgi:hypothetical protein
MIYTSNQNRETRIAWAWSRELHATKRALCHCELASLSRAHTQTGLPRTRCVNRTERERESEGVCVKAEGDQSIGPRLLLQFLPATKLVDTKPTVCALIFSLSLQGGSGESKRERASVLWYYVV